MMKATADGDPIGLWIPMTDTYGNVVAVDSTEPLPSSIVLVDGAFGQAFQRHFGDGMWYSASRSSKGRTWEDILHERNVVLVYDAEERGH